MMRKALVRKGFALAILLAFVAALGMGCCDACKKSVDEAKMYADQAAASASGFSEWGFCTARWTISGLPTSC